MRECMELVADRSLSGGTGGSGTDRPDGNARQAALGGQRQRHSTDLISQTALVAGAACRAALHRARQADAERPRRELQRPPERRMPQRSATHLGRCSPRWPMPASSSLSGATTAIRSGHARNWAGIPSPRSPNNVHVAIPSSNHHEGARHYG